MLSGPQLPLQPNQGHMQLDKNVVREYAVFHVQVVSHRKIYSSLGCCKLSQKLLSRRQRCALLTAYQDPPTIGTQCNDQYYRIQQF